MLFRSIHQRMSRTLAARLARATIHARPLIMKTSRFTLIATAALTLAACATAPTGPSVLVLQGSGKTFEEFTRDDVFCRDYALRQTGGKTPGKAGQDSNVASAAVGTAVGAAAGAALGGRDGAAVGAGTGLLFGSMAGMESGGYERRSSQTMYDHAYIQCMYGAGHRVPVPAGMFPADARPAPRAPATVPTPAPAPSLPPPPPPR